MPAVDRIEDGPDTIRILLTTDNHVGYLENDPIRGDDGWKTFEEITQIAHDRGVDMMLQGGDLFHVNKPSKKSMYHVIKSLRGNCMGDKPCELELLSEPADVMNNGIDEVNYEDPNLNISIPVFAISGNHDDATGEGMLSALDVLAVSGLINYFGKVKDTDSVHVKPILLQKGRTKLALYGMSNLRDERMHRLFRDGAVKFERPGVETDEWFNLFVIHQNHAMHSFKSTIPENFLPPFLDFVLWGHEHECIPHAVHNPETTFDVLQAGSSLATSLCEGEVADKKVFILSIKGGDYSLQPIALQTVRPFVMREIVLSKTDLIAGVASKADVIGFLTQEVEKAIEKVNSTRNAGSNRELYLPLIRLRVEYSDGYEIENAQRFSNQFVGRIANVNDVVQFHKKKKKTIASVANGLIQKTKFDADLLEESLKEKKQNTDLELQDIVSDFLKQTQLTLVPEVGFNDAVKKMLENEDKSSLSQYINSEIKKETKALLNVDIDEAEFHGGDGGNEQHPKKMLKQILMHTKSAGYSGGVDMDMDVSLNSSSTKKKSTTTAAKRSGKEKSKEIIDSSDSEVDVAELGTRQPTSRRRNAAPKGSFADEEADAQIISSEDEYYPEPTKKKATMKSGNRSGSTRTGRAKR
ncbi:uncharacterized protein LODBEIA_P58100 [Lodderomyces beijingensis]|uniref:Double-strand break repair protein n=1 Tax=Lodderomyces beijingensis TaxID=1775926 RepID=A0ABP0ZVW4_9ASCO